MFRSLINQLTTLILISIFCLISSPAYSGDVGSLIEVTPTVNEYAFNVVKPILDSYGNKDRLSQLIKVSEVMTDPKLGVQTNTIEPGKFIIYDHYCPVNR